MNFTSYTGKGLTFKKTITLYKNIQELELELSFTIYIQVPDFPTSRYLQDCAKELVIIT